MWIGWWRASVLFRKLRRQARFAWEFWQFQRKSDGRFPVLWQDRLPFLDDRTTTTHFDRHYVYHPAWAARILAHFSPPKHVDISSTLHFCSLVSAFMPVEFYDYRPAELQLSNLKCGQADLLKLPFPSGSVESLSCMHVVEHVGLGRYGDPLDPQGDRKAMDELQRVLAPRGQLLFVVPTGRPRVVFNAHRIYSYRQIVEAFPDLELRSFALVPDEGPFLELATEEDADRQSYGCGCYWFTAR